MSVDIKRILNSDNSDSHSIESFYSEFSKDKYTTTDLLYIMRDLIQAGIDKNCKIESKGTKVR